MAVIPHPDQNCFSLSVYTYTHPPTFPLLFASEKIPQSRLFRVARQIQEGTDAATGTMGKRAKARESEKGRGEDK